MASHIDQFKCDKCNYSTNDNSNYQRHLKSRKHKKGPVRYECIKCNYKTKDKTRYETHKKSIKHLKITGTGNHLIEKIKREFKQKIARENRSDVYKYKCKMEECKYKTSNKSNFNRHERLHNKTTIYRYKCIACDKLLEDKSKMILHCNCHYHSENVAEKFPETLKCRMDNKTVIDVNKRDLYIKKLSDDKDWNIVLSKYEYVKSIDVSKMIDQFNKMWKKIKNPEKKKQNKKVINFKIDKINNINADQFLEPEDLDDKKQFQLCQFVIDEFTKTNDERLEYIDKKEFNIIAKLMQKEGKICDTSLENLYIECKKLYIDSEGTQEKDIQEHNKFAWNDKYLVGNCAGKI